MQLGSTTLTALLLGLSLAGGCSSSASSQPSAQPEDANVSPAPINPGESEESKEAEKDPTTELVVGIDGERFASEGYNLTAYTIVVKVDGIVAASETLPATTGALPHETRIVALKDRPDALVDIEVQAVMNGAMVVKRRATTRFVKGTTKLAYVFLEIRCNEFGLLGGSGIQGPTCTIPGETCIGAKCRSEELTNLPVYKNDWATNPPSACGAGTSGSLLVGQGQSVTTPLSDGDTLTVECGPQGGNHVWLGLEMKDLAQSGTITTLSASQPGGKTVPPTAYPYAWSASASGMCELTGMRFQLDVGDVKIADLLGKPLDVRIDAEDKAGRKATLTRHLNVAETRSGTFCSPL